MTDYGKVDERVIQALTRIIPDASRLLQSVADRASYAFDASFGTYLPDVVVQPLNTEEVAAVVKLANRQVIPVIPRGQSSSLSGGPLPVKGGIVLDMSHMRQRLEVVVEDLLAIVSPGVVTAEIHAAADEAGLMYPPDPSSSAVSTIGGNLAENAGGPRGLKYGVTKDYVLGLEVVTPQGEVIRTGGRTVKNVTGYDLTNLIVGSEGTLGVITEATLRLIPKPKTTGALMAVFDDLVRCGQAISTLLTSGIWPSKLELMDQACIRAVEAYQPSGLPVDAEAIILVEVDGREGSVAEDLQEMTAIFEAIGARDVHTAQDAAARERLWQARKMVSPAITRIKPTKISEDATVPIGKIPQMLQRLQAIRRRYGIELVVFGHAGDGNLHPNIVADKRDEAEMIQVEQAVAAIFQEAVALGGTLSGEHGIGNMKSPFMAMELGETGLEMMKRIKQAWDPQNILNPGKIFPEPGQKLVLREQVNPL